MNERKFKGVFIRASVWEDAELSWFDKCVLAEIDSLSSPSEPCFASNEWLGERMGVTAATMANVISRLRKRKLIEDISFDGRTRKIRVVDSVAADPIPDESSINKRVKAEFTGLVSPIKYESTDEKEGDPASLAEIPTEVEFIAECKRLLVPEWYALDKFLAKDADGWKRGRWRSFALRVKGWYENDGRPEVPHNRKGSTASSRPAGPPRTYVASPNEICRYDDSRRDY